MDGLANCDAQDSGRSGRESAHEPSSIEVQGIFGNNSIIAFVLAYTPRGVECRPDFVLSMACVSEHTLLCFVHRGIVSSIQSRTYAHQSVFRIEYQHLKNFHAGFLWELPLRREMTYRLKGSGAHGRS